MAKERKWIDIDLGPTRPKAAQLPHAAAGASEDDETVDLNKPVLGATRPLRKEAPEPADEELPLLGPTRPLHRSPVASPDPSLQESTTPPAKDAASDDHVATVPLGVRSRQDTPGPAADETVFNPVVGWLVCVEGARRGHAYELHSARNFIGRDDGMHVRLAEDTSVSGDKHAIVSYDPRSNAYVLTLGPHTTQMVYLNDAAVYAPTPLTHGDVIHVGNTRLRFVPLCDDHFSWQ